MRRSLIAAAVAVLATAAGCGGESEAPTPDQAGPETEIPQVTEEWQSAGELDNMPPEATAELDPPIAPEAIAATFADAGLGDGELTDLGTDAEDCDLTDCVRAFTTGEVTVMVYMSEEMAADASAALGDAFATGPVLLHYAASETPEDIRGDYETALSESLQE